MTDFKHPHRRQNMLTGDWVLVSPQRTKRPWQGSITPPVNEKLSRYVYKKLCHRYGLIAYLS